MLILCIDLPIITVEVQNISPEQQIYALSGGIFGTNVTIVISRGDVLRFELNNLETNSLHPFWIKTVQETGTQNAVQSGISGVAQGSISGRLIWDTNDIIEETYYYVSQYQSGMGGRIRVLPKFEGTTMLKFSF